jgi:hypothetical protein
MSFYVYFGVEWDVFLCLFVCFWWGGMVDETGKIETPCYNRCGTIVKLLKDPERRT